MLNCGYFRVEENLGTFATDRDHSIRSYHVYGKTVMARLYEDDTHDGYFYIYYNPSKQAAERERLEQTVERMKNRPDNEERKEVLKRELKLCGCFCIITSEKMMESEVLYLQLEVGPKAQIVLFNCA